MKNLEDDGVLQRIGLSIVVPAYNEEDNLDALYGSVFETFGGDRHWELILVDDGSEDRTAKVIGELAGKDPRVRGVSLSPNSGQTTAIRVGLARARGSLIATMDADLQNDPADLPAMIDALGPNDAVVGYRTVRPDSPWRRLSSRVANSVRNRVTGDFVRDTGCSLKVFRAEAVRALPLVEGMHRFLPTLLRLHGYQVVEHPVSHRPRLAGRSKYGSLDRALPASVDLMGVRWLASRIRRPDVATIEND